MKEAPTLKFTSFRFRELVSRFTLALEEGGVNIHLWHEGQIFEARETKLKAVTSEALILEGQHAFDGEATATFISLSLKNQHYFARVTALKANELETQAVLADEVYFLEPRTQERLLAVPHHQIYVYLKTNIKDQTPSNVISLKRFKLQKNQLEKIQEKLKHGNHQELLGFRVVDISSSGLSFLVNEDEHAYLDDWKGKEQAITLMFDGQSYFIPASKVIYVTDYVNPRARKVPMYKVGLSFSEHEDLSQKIEDSLEREVLDPYECHAFENFILGKNDVFKI